MEKSLRQKRGGKLKISGPTLISAPKSATSSTISIKDAAARQEVSRPSTAGTSASRRDGIPGALKTGAGGVPGSGPIPRSRDRPANDQTADLVKRRYSTRFTNLPDYSDTSLAPAVPQMPGRFLAGGADDIGGRKPIQFDESLFSDPNFDAEACKYEHARSCIVCY